MKTGGAELRVGIIVVVAAAALLAILFGFVWPNLGRGGYPLNVVFNRADVRPGDEVAMSGVVIGRVMTTGLDAENRAVVRLQIKRGVALHQGDRVTIIPGALLGQSLVEIIPAPPSRAGPKLDPGAQLHGERYLRLEDLVPDAERVLERMTTALDSFSATVNDQRLRRLVYGTVASLADAARETAALGRTLNAMAIEARPNVRLTAANLQAVSADLRQTSQVLARAATETTVPQHLEETARRISSVAAKVDDIVGQLRQLATDPETKEFAMTAMRNLRAASDEIRRAGEDVRAVTAAVAQDAPAITANIREAMANVRDASADVKQSAHAAGAGIAAITGRATEAAKKIESLPPVKTELTVGSQYLTDPRRWWVDANLEISTRDRLLRVGAADVGESDRFNLQFGGPLGRGRARYGIIESKVGAGFDWRVTPWLTLTTEVFDLNDLRANVLGAWTLGGERGGLDVIAGYRGVGGEGSPALGLRATK